jgi:hypothetical protein
MAFKKFTKVVWQGKRTAVKQITWPDETKSYDIYEWDLGKMRWKKNTHMRGYGLQTHAVATAEKRDKEIQDMLDANREPPEPISTLVATQIVS